MLVDDRLGHVGTLRDLFDRGPVIASFGEQRARDADELVSPLATGHPGARRPRLFFRLFVQHSHVIQGIGLREPQPVALTVYLALVMQSVVV